MTPTAHTGGYNRKIAQGVTKSGKEYLAVGCPEGRRINEGSTNDDQHVAELTAILLILEKLPERHRRRIIGALTRLLPHELDSSHRLDQ